MEPFWFIVCWAKQFDIRDITISNNNQNGNWQQNDIGVHSNTMNPGNQKTDVPFIPLHRADRFTKVSKTKLIGESGIIVGILRDRTKDECTKKRKRTSVAGWI